MIQMKLKLVERPCIYLFIGLFQGGLDHTLKSIGYVATTGHKCIQLQQIQWKYFILQCESGSVILVMINLFFQQNETKIT